MAFRSDRYEPTDSDSTLRDRFGKFRRVLLGQDLPHPLYIEGPRPIEGIYQPNRHLLLYVYLQTLISFPNPNCCSSLVPAAFEGVLVGLPMLEYTQSAPTPTGSLPGGCSWDLTAKADPHRSDRPPKSVRPLCRGQDLLVLHVVVFVFNGAFRRQHTFWRLRWGR